MSVLYCVHDASGRIINTGHCQDDMAEAQAQVAGEVGIEIPNQCDARTHYVTGGVLMPRPAFSLAFSKSTISGDGVDSTTLSDLPAGTVVSGAIGRHVVDDGSLSFASFAPGIYDFQVEAFPMQAGTLTVTVT